MPFDGPIARRNDQKGSPSWQRSRTLPLKLISRRLLITQQLHITI
jgi:hypothetical protein